MSSENMKAALDYFKDDPGFQQLFAQFKKKYESLGRIGGAVDISAYSNKEVQPIARFFGKSEEELLSQKKVSLVRFEKQLQNTKFEGLSLKELLEAFFQTTLISKKEAKLSKQHKEQVLLEKWATQFPELAEWMSYLEGRHPDSYWIYGLLDQPVQFECKLAVLTRSIRDLPNSFERLPVFSQKITGDPHALDLNTVLGKLWIHVLAVTDGVVIPSDSEAINSLLQKYNLLRDDITNYVTVANLLAEKDAEVHPLWEAAAQTVSVMNVPLREIVQLTSVYPASDGTTVWVVENSGVFSSILDQVPNAPLICTHGQFKLAALQLLDQLVRNGCMIYYSSDLDPEGVRMATRLYNRYPNSVHYWRMDVDAYEKSLSEVHLNVERLNRLASVDDAYLQPVLDRMRFTKKAGYQEALVSDMVADLADFRA
ncbi:TIGR02679 family protein [Halobacillus amylolyticus]|uniref:TIGR02679 family protein n=1 Tax=Halobacillus amylolyticus TaxID=2932259 RepID=A0ABY4HGS0_9BACI|nr:TIGR02679 family protein [Halobacillus amylolyticus]UOR13488.1 TIGR02679 family protein [Halobacillus amylolyticus]